MPHPTPPACAAALVLGLCATVATGFAPASSVRSPRTRRSAAEIVRVGELGYAVRRVDLGLTLGGVTRTVGPQNRTLFVYEATDQEFWNGDNPYGGTPWPGAVSAAARFGPKLQGKLVMELGCGNGAASLAAAAHGATVLATDVSVEARALVNAASKQLGLTSRLRSLHFDVCDLGGTKLPPKADLVVVSDLLYDERLAMGAALRVLEAQKLGIQVLVASTCGRAARRAFLATLASVAAKDLSDEDEDWVLEKVAFDKTGLRFAPAPVVTNTAMKWKAKHVETMEWAPDGAASLLEPPAGLGPVADSPFGAAQAKGDDVTCLFMVGGVNVPNAKDSPQARSLDGYVYPAEWPYSAADLRPEEPGNDGAFYFVPRFVQHAGDECRAALTEYYGAVLPEGGSVLDLCSSWTSHYPDDKAKKLERCAITGMNALELMRNPHQTEWKTADLNVDPTLAYDDASFDVVTNALSVDYMTEPRRLFAEIARTLKPGGLCTCAFTNRCFPQKVVGMWLRPQDDTAHIKIVASYLHFAGFVDIAVADCSPPGFVGMRDPLFVVQARKAV